MPRYSAVWLEISRAQYETASPEAREQIDVTISRMLENPQADGSYDEHTDQWTTTYGDGTGLIVYAVVPAYEKVILLRVIH